MPQRTSKDGNRVILTEWETRQLDAYGDAVDVTHWDSEALARAYAAKLTCPAWVIEKHTSRRPMRFFAEPDTYVTVTHGGDPSALREGGWIE